MRELEARLTRLESDVDGLRAAMAPPVQAIPDATGTGTVETVRRRLDQPVTRSATKIGQALSIAGIVDDPSLPTDLSARWHEHRYAAGRSS